MDKRGFLRVLVAATLAAALLSGCSSVKNLFGGRNKDKAGEPVKLVDFAATANVNRLWSVSVGKGEGRLGIGQQPAEWVYYLPLPPLFLLIFSGLDMFFRPYFRRRGGAAG